MLCFNITVAVFRFFIYSFNKKEAKEGVFSCNFGDVFKNSFFSEHLRVAAFTDFIKILGK